MQKINITTIARILLGLILVIFGLNKFFNFMPPMTLGPDAQKFFNALIDSGYIFQVVGLFEVLIGILLISNKLVNLALIALVPIAINFLLFHFFLDIKNIPPALLVTALQCFLIIKKYDSLRSLLK